MQSGERQSEKKQTQGQTHSHVYKERQVQSEYTDGRETDTQSDKQD